MEASNAFRYSLHLFFSELVKTRKEPVRGLLGLEGDLGCTLYIGWLLMWKITNIHVQIITTFYFWGIHHHWLVNVDEFDICM